MTKWSSFFFELKFARFLAQYAKGTRRGLKYGFHLGA